MYPNLWEVRTSIPTYGKFGLSSRSTEGACRKIKHVPNWFKTVVNKSTKTVEPTKNTKKIWLTKHDCRFTVCVWIPLHKYRSTWSPQLNLRPGHMRGRKESPGSAKTPPVSDLLGGTTSKMFLYSSKMGDTFRRFNFKRVNCNQGYGSFDIGGSTPEVVILHGSFYPRKHWSLGSFR